MERVTEQEYKEALAVIKRYEKQLKQDKLGIYIGCTEEDLCISTGRDLYNYEITYYWVTKEKNPPNRDADQSITKKGDNFFTIMNSQKVYHSFDEAEKAIIKSFKRKKYING